MKCAFPRSARCKNCKKGLCRQSINLLYAVAPNNQVDVQFFTGLQIAQVPHATRVNYCKYFCFDSKLESSKVEPTPKRNREVITFLMTRWKMYCFVEWDMF